MDHFGFHWHFLLHEQEIPELNRYFEKIGKKLDVFKRNAIKTTELYQKQHAEDLKLGKEAFDAQMKAGDEIYYKIIEEYGDNETGRSLANHEAGYMYHQDDYENLVPYLEQTYADIKDSYNKSSLAVLYALFETETSRLCSIMQSRYGKLIDHESLGGSDYILKYLKYLKLVIEMDVAALEQFVDANLKPVKLLRNKIIHHDSEFPGETTELLQIIENSNGMVIQTDGQGTLQISINNIEYIIGIAALVERFFQDLFWAVEQKTNYVILLNKIQYLFSAFDPNITATLESFGRIPKGYQIIVRLHSATVPEMCCKAKISIKGTNQNSIELLNQLDNYPRMTEFHDFLNQNPNYIFKQLLQGTNITGAPQDVKILLYP
ncbi:hypothetical protein [Arcticibacter tournemirensis]